jgi:oligoendopeptidase F
MPATTLPPRNAIAPEHTWNAPSVFASLADWDTEYQRLQDELPAFERYQGHLGENAQTLADALDMMFALANRVETLVMFAMISASVDTANQESVALQGKATSISGRVSGAVAFVDPELLVIGNDRLREWIGTEPRLAAYDHYFDNLFRSQAHVRSPEVEEVLGMATDPLATPRASTTMLTNAEIRFVPATSATGATSTVAQGTISTLLYSTDRETRRTAWENYADGYLAVKNTLAANLTGAIKTDIFHARARHYASALEAALFPNNIPLAVYQNVTETFRRNLPIWHRYWALRRRVLHLDTQYTYDIKVPLTAADPEISFAQAVDWISEGVRPLGEEYVSVLRRGCLEERWVDIYPNQGKRAGAFSYGTPGTHPFIVMSYDDTLKSMSTLAHELGHSMHSYLAWHTQPLVNCHYSHLVAETASNFHQAMVRAYLFDTHADRDFQIALIDEAMNNFHRYLFIMPTLARFELATHERVERGESLTADYMIDFLADLLAEGYGGEVALDRERDGITWAEFNHLFSNFYVFQYTTGISAAHALARGVLAGGDAAERYLAFLRAGNALYPIDALKLAGVDITAPDPIEQAFQVLDDTITRLEQLTTG